MNLPYIDEPFITENTEYVELIGRIEEAFRSNNIRIPERHHHHSSQNSMLLMPALEDNKYWSVKIVNVFPDNRQVPSINGIVMLSDGLRGEPLAILDGAAITKKRTAATSALASKYLSRENASSLLVCGNGTLAPEMIMAHSSIRRLGKIFIWGRDIKKSKDIAARFPDKTIKILPVLDPEYLQCDIISTVTSSAVPLFNGEWVGEGSHLDLVGSYLPAMREVDDKLIQRCTIYTDTDSAIKESGDLAIPLERGIISRDDVKGNLYDLCQDKVEGRVDDLQITLFKSVGYALEDHVAAIYYYQKWKAVHA